jgi:hypothetical protein
VNVSVQGATSVFLTFGGVAGHEALDATWCGALVLATPHVGARCAPGTIFGQLPARFDLSRASGTSGFTDIMTILPSMARRAYQAAERGDPSAFFDVRRFRSLSGGPDQFIAVTCRLTGGGARTPLALTGVQLMFDPDLPVLQVSPDEPLPPISARLAYNGTGRLVGRAAGATAAPPAVGAPRRRAPALFMAGVRGGAGVPTRGRGGGFGGWHAVGTGGGGGDRGSRHALRRPTVVSRADPAAGRCAGGSWRSTGADAC